MATKKTRHHLTYTVIEFEKGYQKELKEKEETGMCKKVYKEVMKEFFELLSQKIIREKYVFRMPYRLGTIRITKEKTKIGSKGAIDHNATKRLGKTIYHTNKHTGGFFFKWKWFSNRFYTHFKNSSFYSFTPVRDPGKREVGKLGLSDWVRACSDDPYVKDYDVLQG